MNRYLSATELLDYYDKAIQKLVEQRGWRHLGSFERIKRIYNYVKDEIQFGYNIDDALSASKVLADGYGQCNTKAILVMALLRAVDIPCRFHAFTLNKQVQSGVLGFLYHLSPPQIIHTWAEVWFENQWYPLEGLILDREYLKSVQLTFNSCSGTFCGWGLGTRDIQNPDTEWEGKATYIQKEGIVDDLGLYDTPDDFYIYHQQKLTPIKRFLYQKYGRHYMNRKVQKMRDGFSA